MTACLLLLLCFRALRLADAHQRSSNDLTLKQDRQCMNPKLRRFRANIIVVKKQQLLHIVSE
jgi:hypothetical protein